MEINGQLVNPVTGEVLGDLEQADAPSPYTAAGKLSADFRAGLITEDQYRAGLAQRFFTGRGGALIKLRDMRELIADAARSAEAVTVGEYTPQQRTPASQKLDQLSRLLAQYDAVIANLEGTGQGRTSGGVQWRSEE